MGQVTWRPAYRLVASRFPPVGILDTLVDAADLEMFAAIEGMTNARLRDAVGEFELVRPEDRVVGPGTTPIMAAFTYLNPNGSRFSDGTYGVYYAGVDVATAIAETAYHQAKFLTAGKEAPTEVDMRCYIADVDVDLVDLRGERGRRPDLYDPDSYGAGQAYARDQRAAGALGLVWDSVRHPGGQCVGLFKPRCVIPPCLQSVHYAFVWDGHAITKTYEKSNLQPLV